MLEVHLEGETRLDSIGRKLRAATAREMNELTEIMFDKVIANLSGEVLNKQTGELVSSIQKRVVVDGDFYEGSVFVEPETPKAWVLEKGGEKSYVIVPVKARLLHFFSKNGEEVFASSVLHPPSKEFAYLRLALEAMEGVVPEGFRNAIQIALDSGAYE